jgi:hypothetical protein
MLSLLAVALPMLGTSKMVQREGLGLAFRCRVYHMGMASAEVYTVLSVFAMRLVCIWGLDGFVHLNCLYQRYRIRCIL